MAKTRTTFAFPDDDGREALESLLAAAQSLEDKGQNSLLYNSQVIDYVTNGNNAGATKLAWYYWSKIPELRYTTRYIANALSVATLYVGEVDPNGGEPIRLKEGHPAVDLMKAFAGGQAGQAEVLDRLGLHLTVAGDSVAIGPKNGSSNEQAPFDQWRIYSTEEVSSRNGKIYLKFPGNAKEVQVPDSMAVIRVWRPNPVFWWNADSPVIGSFSVLRELDLLDQHVHASAVSRLAGAGLMGIPEELDLPSSDIETDGNEIDKFVALLTEVMGLAIKNRDSAAAMVPIMLRGPAEYIDKIKHFDFSTEFSQMVPDLRMGAIRRLALGMDVPPEILLGSAQSTSWSSWQTDESTLRVHLIPLLQLIASSLTVGWLQPALKELPLSKAQQDQIPNLVVHFDVSKLKIHQDISGDAQALFDRDIIGAEALRHQLGYRADDEPSKNDLAYQILLKLVNSSQPDLVNYAIEGLRKNFGVTQLPEAASGTAPTPPGPGAPQKPTPPKTTPVTGPLPGKRSQSKQVSPPPVPKIGDNSNNEVK